MKATDPRAQAILDALAPLCVCQPPPHTDGPQRECLIHGETEDVVADLIAAREFRTEVFDLAAWDRGRRWGYDTVADRTRPLTDAAADPQEEHYRRQVVKYSEMLSRMMGRLVGFRQARDELADLGREARAQWTGGRSGG